MIREGILYVISAPSGAGKTSLCKEVIDIFPDLRHSISFTTRLIRPGEEEGKDYYFISKTEFDRMVHANEFAEWAAVHGNFYGTSLEKLEMNRKAGLDVILDIDCQGARQLKDRYRGGVYIFILPPDFDVLRQRLNNRNTDSDEVINRRLQNAAAEIKESRWYDYVIINDDFSTAVEELKSVIIAESCRSTRVLDAVSQKFEI